MGFAALNPSYRVAKPRRLAFGHLRRMVARDQPLLAVPGVGIRVASLDLRAGLVECKCVQAGIEGAVAADFDEAEVDLSRGLVFEEVFEVVQLLRRREARLV